MITPMLMLTSIENTLTAAGDQHMLVFTAPPGNVIYRIQVDADSAARINTAMRTEAVRSAKLFAELHADCEGHDEDDPGNPRFMGE